MNVLPDTAATLERELDWLSAVADTSIRLYFGQDCRYSDVRELAPPELDGDSSFYARFVSGHEMTFDERVILVLSLAPHIRPQLLDPFLVKNPNFDRGFTEFGGIVSANHGGFWPSAEIAAFILAGPDLERRMVVQALLDPDHFFRRKKILGIEDAHSAQSLFSTALTLGKEHLFRITTGCGYKPGFSSEFPAKRITTAHDWDDLVLPGPVLDEVEEIRAWIEHRDTLMGDWKLEKRIKPGFRSLFYGPPGTGKTLTAALLGKTTKLDVYRIDLSLVVSKWVGETENNLASVFDQAEINDWILFFDEADALFGKRTQTSTANDRYANQEVAYLLQRIEDFPGVVILATNLKGNIDEAFARRFQSMIYFPIPAAGERLRLWSGAFPERRHLQESVDLEQLAEELEVTGGAIVNVLRYSSLMTLRRGADMVNLADIRQGIRREFRKQGKVL